MSTPVDDPTDLSLEVPVLPTQRGPGAPRPGLVVVWEAGQPACRAVPFDGGAIEVGRGGDAQLALADGSVSRQHARVTWEPAGLVVEDLGSRHGTCADGEPVHGRVEVRHGCVLRFGATLALALRDVGPCAANPTAVEGGRVLGPSTRAALARVALAARGSVPLLVLGESGVGKDDVARRYHEASGRPGRLVELNAASIPRDLVEAELFGTRRGAYSGAVDRDGAFAMADRGTLLLDEIGELPLDLQPKLLRALESRTIVPLGGAAPERVDVRFVSATNRDLGDRVRAGHFRQDLLMRLAHEVVRLPALRDRREEIPWLVALGLARAWKELGVAPLPASVTLVEACCLRAWADENVRGLLAAVGSAAREALLHEGDAVHGRDLPADAGLAGEIEAKPARSATLREEDRAGKKRAFRAALVKHGGDVGRAAAEVGVSRATGFRWMGG